MFNIYVFHFFPMQNAGMLLLFFRAHLHAFAMFSTTSMETIYRIDQRGKRF